MKKIWELNEIIDHFTFLPNEFAQIGNKTGETRLGFGVMFKLWSLNHILIKRRDGKWGVMEIELW